MLSKEIFSTREAIRQLANYSNGDTVICQQNGFAYTYDATSTATDDDNVTMKPHNAQTGRWIRSNFILSPLPLATLPSASATYAGKIVYIPGVIADAGATPPVVGTIDQVKFCYKLANDTYAWVSLIPT